MKNSQQDDDYLLASPSSPASTSRTWSDSIVQDNGSEVAGDILEDGHSRISNSQTKRYVRFDVTDQPPASGGSETHHNTSFSVAGEAQLTDNDNDFLNSSDDDDLAIGGGTTPLLTSIAAPSVVVAGMTLGDSDSPSARSSMNMAFMNMANSIM
ncbi:hypothetical protein DRE_04835 [Drechslerella stenobrocha 248]|uniref:Uncharacterized protein n=1 Tax=Drechslerella stenobrocha 248 TaxID=1043628 RepID=W7I0S6_9PEZI|nr:hypothetical protein DRE_04835 [Drechslerella stenobrocha 248]